MAVNVEPETSRTCPDGGTCHHSCGLAEACFRVKACGPLSNVFPNDTWPAAIIEEENKREVL